VCRIGVNDFAGDLARKLHHCERSAGGRFEARFFEPIPVSHSGKPLSRSRRAFAAAVNISQAPEILRWKLGHTI
jgi:hypothetical protein